MKLSNEITDQLKQCEKIGVWESCKTTPHLSLFIPAVDYDIVPLELGRNGEMSRTVQCLLVEALEQFAEARGYWFYFDKNHTGTAYVCQILTADRDKAKTLPGLMYARTRLQAALDAFLAVDWSKDETPL